MTRRIPPFFRPRRSAALLSNQHEELLQYEIAKCKTLMLEIDRLKHNVFRQEEIIALQARIMEDQKKLIEVLFGEKVSLCDSIGELKAKLAKYEVS